VYQEHGAPSFLAWLKRNQLDKKPEEPELEFAFRSFRHIRSTMSLAPKPVTHASGGLESTSPSTVIKARRSGAEGLCELFVAVLMANQIPARVVCGIALDSVPAPGAKGDVALSYRAEFFCEGLGWIPVMLAESMTPSAVDTDSYFARDDGRFVGTGYRGSDYGRIGNLVNGKPLFLIREVKISEKSRSITNIDECYSHRWSLKIDNP
jgi:transglutaminase-like putative cysteine protease